MDLNGIILMKSLLDKCSEYEKTAGISVQKNTDTVLKELSELKSFDERIKFATKQWGKPLGEGSSRTAFQINDDLIIKIAHNDKGIAQNKVEMSPGVQRECVNCCLVADAQGRWIIFRDTEDLTEKKFKELVGFSFNTFMNSLFYSMNNESDRWSEPRDFNEIQKNSLFLCLANIIFKNQLLIGDLDKISSWGLLNGKPVIRDAGLDKETFNEYYKDNSSSSSSTPPKTSS